MTVQQNLPAVSEMLRDLTSAISVEERDDLCELSDFCDS
jgi:hypothetical protein